MTIDRVVACDDDNDVLVPVQVPGPCTAIVHLINAPVRMSRYTCNVPGIQCSIVVLYRGTGIVHCTRICKKLRNNSTTV
jgi:hypothetical protein